jgi:hypothetical protein
MVAGRISLPPAADWEKQGKTGLDAGAPREASDSILCKRGKPADKPVSPPSFPNEIRTAIDHAFKRDKQRTVIREIWLRL